MSKKHGKKYREVSAALDKTKVYSVEEAVPVVKKASFVQFDPTVEVHFQFNLDPNKADQQLRGTVTLPHGTGKKKKILVFAKGEKEQEAQQAGADYVGSAELIEKIKGGWLDFDVAIATPDMMGEVGKIAKIIGTKGLMPNPKSGTVTMDVGATVESFKKGRVEYRLDKQANMHTYIGKASFSDEQLIENFQSLHDALLRAKPKGAKGQYIKKVYMHVTMGPSVQLQL